MKSIVCDVELKLFVLYWAGDSVVILRCLFREIRCHGDSAVVVPSLEWYSFYASPTKNVGDFPIVANSV